MLPSSSKVTGDMFLPRRGYCVEELKFYVRPLSDVCPSDVCCNHFLNQKSAASRAVFDVSWVQKWSKSDHSLKMNQKSAASRAVIDVSWVQFWSPTTQEPLRGHLALQVLSSRCFSKCFSKQILMRIKDQPALIIRKE